MKLLAALLLTASLHAADPAPIAINVQRIHLGTPGSPEWEWFANDPDPARPGRLDLPFRATTNTIEATLLLRQDDVKQEWPVELNGKRIGKLFLMEADLIYAIALPSGSLRDGDNVLSLIPPAREKDDVVLHAITVLPRPLADVLREAALDVKVEDPDGKPLPARITIADEHGTLVPLLAAPGETLAVRPGVAYTGTGRARLGLRAGRCTVYASRGFEYGMASQTVDLRAGESRELTLRIAREVSTPGLVSCDTHIHTLTHSGHGDSTLDERMLTLAGEGIELPIATEHNLHADYSEAAKQMGVANDFTPVIGNEVTTAVGHFNIFPVEPGAGIPNPRLTDWTALSRAMRAVPGVRVVILNHPRSLHSNFRPFGLDNFDPATGEFKRPGDLQFDALEVLNSGAQQTDYLLAFRDWFALLNRGRRITAVGASDSHDVSRFIVGQARTYLAAPDTDPAHINVATACDSLLAGRAYVSMGLLPLLTVEDRFTVGDLATGLPEQVRVRVKVLGPSWVKAAHVELFANGVTLREADIPPDRAGLPGEKADIAWTIPRPARDTWLVAIATGPAVTAPFWAMTHPYQPQSPQWQGRSLGATNPLWLDIDGDQRFTPPTPSSPK
jgi:hypothetical protein